VLGSEPGGIAKTGHGDTGIAAAGWGFPDVGLRTLPYRPGRRISGHDASLRADCRHISWVTRQAYSAAGATSRPKLPDLVPRD
jgi:hypothetical protein